MLGIREYLIGVIAAALLCGIVCTLMDGKSTTGVAIRLISGFLMLLAVLRPWVNLHPEGLFQWAENFSADGAVYVAEGENIANDYYRSCIKQQLESYILDEAKAFDCCLTVEVILSDDAVAKPRQIRLTGDISPYARQALTNFLMQQLGLSREDLIWT